MTAVTTTATPYLVKLPGRSDFDFQRKVPSGLIQSMGQRLWRWKAGNTLTEARKAVVESLHKTVVLIAQHRGEVTPALLEHVDENLTPDPLTVTSRDFREVDGQEVEVSVEEGISPKACRDAVATELRDTDIHERVLGAILGHTPKNSTGVYGSVSMEAKQRALAKLIK